MRYDLVFFLCCCKSFLGPDDEDDENSNYYALLGVDRDASADEIKRAYKRQSLQMHPDKLAQKGQEVTPEHQACFTHMKEAYEVLSDPHQRETYDAIGARGLKWLEEPFSMDPQELAHNFAKSSVLDRSKIFSIFVAFAIAVLMLPVLVCLHADGAFGANASWFATLVPLWLWDAFLVFYHVRVILMGPIPRPEHVPAQEWIDPLPMKKRIFSLVRFVLIVLFEILVACKLDGVVRVPWTMIFFPLYVWEATTLYKKLPLARMRIVTVQDLETALGKPFSEFTAAEKELIGKRYSVVPSTSSPDFDAAQKLKTRARHDIIKSVFRILFCFLLLIQLDGSADWNWWFVFLPFWVMTALICYANYQSFAEVQQMAMEKDPTLFGMPPANMATGTAGDMDVETGPGTGATPSSYGAMGDAGAATSDAAAAATSNTTPLTEEEREELKAQVMASSSRMCGKCCSQGFLLIIVFLMVAKLQGAGYSSLWILSPFFLVAGIILCCLGCAIFGITEVPTDGVDFDAAVYGYTNASDGTTPAAAATAAASGPTVYVPPPPASTSDAAAVQVQVPTPPPAPTEPDRTGTSTTESSLPVGATVIHPPPAAPVDLLDSTTAQQEGQAVESPPPQAETATPGELHELD